MAQKIALQGNRNAESHNCVLYGYDSSYLIALVFNSPGEKWFSAFERFSLLNTCDYWLWTLKLRRNYLGIISQSYWISKCCWELSNHTNLNNFSLKRFKLNNTAQSDRISNESHPKDFSKHSDVPLNSKTVCFTGNSQCAELLQFFIHIESIQLQIFHRIDLYKTSTVQANGSMYV